MAAGWAFPATDNIRNFIRFAWAEYLRAMQDLDLWWGRVDYE